LAPENSGKKGKHRTEDTEATEGDLGLVDERAQVTSRSRSGKTVHVLQGAEASRRYFFFGLRRKRSRYAVCGRWLVNFKRRGSRAQHSFIVFGFMEHFRGSEDTPSGLLGRLLFEESENEITNFYPPRRLSFEEIPLDPRARLQQLSTLAEHRQTLVDLIRTFKSRLLIVSP
jgi:hypothetical protein